MNKKFVSFLKADRRTNLSGLLALMTMMISVNFIHLPFENIILKIFVLAVILSLLIIIFEWVFALILWKKNVKVYGVRPFVVIAVVVPTVNTFVF